MLRHGEARTGQEVVEDVAGAQAIEQHMEKPRLQGEKGAVAAWAMSCGK